MTSEKLKSFQTLFKNQKYDELIEEIEKIVDKNSVILNIYAVSKLMRNNGLREDKLSALENFEKAYLMDKYSLSGLDALTNFINLGIEFKIFDKIFNYYDEAIKNFDHNHKLLESIQRVYQYQYRVSERHNILKKLVENKSNSPRIWTSYIYTSNFLSEFDLQEEHYNDIKNFDQILKDFNLGDLQLDKNILEKKIKIGFLSSDLEKNHSIIFFLKSLLKNFDKNKFNIIAIGNLNDEKSVNNEISSYFDQIFSISKYNDLDAISFIRSKKIDVMIDVMGLTGDNRPTLFKNRIAPIQINWLGYCNTTGIKNMDFIFSDPNLIKKNEEKYYYEKIKHLPRIWNCHSGLPIERKIISPPSLIEDKFTFGSFNNFNKISNLTLDCWEKILKQSENTRLILKSSLEYFPNHIEKKFKERGISDQITILKKSDSFFDHLETYNRIDLALDTFPYNGVTTTFEALWKSVPVLTIKGNNFVSRCGYSILKNLGIEYLIANNVNDYVSKAVYLSNNLDYLKNIREDLFKRMTNSSLFDDKNFAEEFQSLIIDCINEKLQSS